jgi:diaminohydroxyphosphoribosylaminopyrimidine deaminase/5-amino-6-(5-phosphoribosylamino)uracil reductase
LTGVNTILADDPSLTCRTAGSGKIAQPGLRRIILDSHARIPITAKVLCDDWAHLTTVVTTEDAPPQKRVELAQMVSVWRAPEIGGRVDLHWLLKRLGEENVTCLLVEGGGEVNGAFMDAKLAHRIAFFYAPLILGGRSAHKGVAGAGFRDLHQALSLKQAEWKKMGADLYLTALV